MNLFSKALSLAALSVLSASAVAGSRYVLSFDSPTGLDAFLTAQRLQKIGQIPGQAIYQVKDLDDRTESQVVEAAEAFDAQDNVDNLQIYADVSVGMSETAAASHLISTRTYLESALLHPTLGSYYGAPAPLAFASQPAALQTWVPVARSAFGLGGSIVAVIDTGVDPEHDFLKPVLLPGYDFTRDLAGAASEMEDLSPSQQAVINPTTIPLLHVNDITTVNASTQAVLSPESRAALVGDPLPAAFGHGTMVAGAVRLVAPGAKILPLKAFNSNGTGTLFNIVRAIYYAQEKGARVINLSLSCGTKSRELEKAIRFVSNRGVTCVASAGNDGLKTEDVYPAAISGVIGVASVNSIDARSLFSNYGQKIVKISAPGEEMLLPYPGGRWAGGWGTSFAAPMVSGTAALLLSANPNSTVKDIQKAFTHAAPLEGEMGSGRLNVYQSLMGAWWD